MVAGAAAGSPRRCGPGPAGPRVRSGGQTGVDRAALDAARAGGLETVGWCPRGRRAEDGVVPARYRLRETPSPEYAERTEWNVRDSDATLILHRGVLSGGTELTRRLAESMGKPVLVVDLTAPPGLDDVAFWIHAHAPADLNVAGPRESSHPGIHRQARHFLKNVFGLAAAARGSSGASA